MYKRMVVALLALTAGIVCGCGATRPSKYYQLRAMPPTPPATTVEVYPVTLIVTPLAGSHLYRDDRLVYSSGEEELGTYQYQRWATPPIEMIQEMLLRDLRSCGRFREVHTLSSSASGDYVLRGHLYDFKEVSGHDVLARLTIEFELHNVKSGDTAWTFFYTHDEPVTNKDVQHVVSALDQNVQRCANELMAKLDEYFASHASQSSVQGDRQH